MIFYELELNNSHYDVECDINYHTDNLNNVHVDAVSILNVIRVEDETGDDIFHTLTDDEEKALVNAIQQEFIDNPEDYGLIF